MGHHSSEPAYFGVILFNQYNYSDLTTLARAKGGRTVQLIERSENEWRQQLTPEQFHILREAGTERPFSSALNNEHRNGVFRCAGCELDLFTSEMKFDSGTGWPSFFTHIEGHLEITIDFKLIYPRTEYHCIRCGGHHGHRFSDGPKPSGERWCSNGAVLLFVANRGIDSSGSDAGNTNRPRKIRNDRATRKREQK